jgi:hypothetical protein
MSPLENASGDGAKNVPRLHDYPPWVFRALNHAQGFEVANLLLEFSDSLR